MTRAGQAALTRVTRIESRNQLSAEHRDHQSDSQSAIHLLTRCWLAHPANERPTARLVRKDEHDNNGALNDDVTALCRVLHLAAFAGRSATERWMSIRERSVLLNIQGQRQKIQYSKVMYAKRLGANLGKCLRRSTGKLNRVNATFIC